MKLVTLLLGSWTGLVLLFLYVPIVVLIVYSFNASRMNVRWEGFTLKWYRQLWDNRPLLDALWNSLIIAAWTTGISTVLGTVGAWLMYRYRYPAARLMNTLVVIPMVIPEIIMGVSLLIFFATVGVRLGMETVIVSHVTFCFPFVLIAVRARLAGLDPALEEAAMDLGATPLQAFVRVLVPYLLPGIISGALMSFTLSMDELIVTYFVYSADSMTLPIRIFGEVKKGLNPMLNAVSAIFIAGTAVLVVVAEYVRRIGAVKE
jgi:spermidine/putrescine transport system permease protein